MTFLNQLTEKYMTTAASGTIKTNEPIKIEWKIADNMMVITVDGIDYATIDDVSSQDQVDLDEVKYWVENTYYDEDYKSSAYTPCQLKGPEFKKAVEADVLVDDMLKKNDITDMIQNHEWKVIKVPNFFSDTDKNRFVGESGKLFTPRAKAGFNYLKRAKEHKNQLEFENGVLTLPWDYQGHKDTIQFKML